MLTLTKKTEYALIATCHLARVTQGVVSAREIAELHSVPLPLLMNVLKQLNQGGIVSSVRGAHGGYALAVPAAKLPLATLIKAVEGPVRLVNCAPSAGAARGCERSSLCSLRPVLHKLHKRLVRFLDEVTIADIAFDGDYVERVPLRERGKVGAK